MEQFFLCNREKIEAIVDAARIEPDDAVVEVGAGQGTVAERILPRLFGGAGSLTLVDLDEHLCAGLEAKFAQNAGVKVVQDDAIAHLRRRTGTDSAYDVVVSNLPSSLTRDLVAALVGDGGACPRWKSAVIAVHATDDDVSVVVPSNLFSVTVVTYLVGSTDFNPPQPFDSKIVLIRPIYSS